MLLQELLREVLEVSARELGVGDNDDLSLSLSGDLDGLAKVSGSSVNLDSVVQELLECSTSNVRMLASGHYKRPSPLCAVLLRERNGMDGA